MHTTNVISDRAQNLERIACDLESLAENPDREFESAEDRRDFEKRMRDLAQLLREDAKESTLA